MIYKQQKTTWNTQKCSIRPQGNKYLAFQVVVARLGSGLSPEMDWNHQWVRRALNAAYRNMIIEGRYL